jgi:hypothetical protein
MPIEYEGDGISLQVLLQTFVCVEVTFWYYQLQQVFGFRSMSWLLIKAHLIITNSKHNYSLKSMKPLFHRKFKRKIKGGPSS